MSRVIFKLKYQHPNKGQKTRKNNKFHMLYIATREGVALNDDIKEINNEESNNKDYMKYISHRPGSHGLFGNYKDLNLTNIGKELENYNGYVYRAIVSLRENDAIDLGYDKKEKWEELIKDRIFYMSKELGIPYSKLSWVGAFHRESGHPHVHLMIWNKDEEVRSKNGIIDTKKIENIRKNLTNTIFRQERESILLEKNALRDIIIENAKKMNNIEVDLEKELKFINLELKTQVENINKFEIGNKIPKKLIKDIGKEINKLKVPDSGRLQYKLMPKEVKEDINQITKKILSEKSFERYFDRYMDSVEKYTCLYTNKHQDILESKNRAKEDMYNRIGNIILKTKKELLLESKIESNYNSNKSEYKIQNMLYNVFKVISQSENKNNTTRNYATKSKANRKNMANKMRAKGLYSENDINKE